MVREGITLLATHACLAAAVKHSLLLGDIKRAVASDTDVILFNIDNKADNRAGRDAIRSGAGGQSIGGEHCR